MMCPSEMDFSSSISQLGTPGMLGFGFRAVSSGSPSKEMPSAAASAFTLATSLARISSEMREISSICSSFISYAFRRRYWRLPSCSHSHPSKVMEPLPSSLIALLVSRNQNFRLSPMDSRMTVPCICTHCSSLGSIRRPRAALSWPASSASTFQTSCIASKSHKTTPSPPSSPKYSAKAAAALMAIILDAGSSEMGTKMVQFSQQPRALSSLCSSSASSRVRQTTTFTKSSF
mmetsp:Transcript_4851/g.11115  ORF Transcript_4851/g.11115 Transcript_4851/m.11115 type:complete len:232 (-) Transcript_4851:899-1594(-)